MAKAYALVVGMVLIVVGVIGFLKSQLFMLHFNTPHNSIHLVSGIIGLWAGMSKSANAARIYAQVFGVIYTVVALAGLAHVPAGLSAMLDLNLGYNVIHLVIGVLGLLAGFTGAKTAATA